MREHADRLRGVVLIGQDRAKIADALARHAPDVPVVDLAATDTGAMDLVVARAADLAHEGDVVLLAPAAASMDMFDNYGARGDAFVAAVRRLARAAGVAMTSTAAKARASGSRFGRVRHWFGRFESPTTTYYLLLATTAILVVFGLIMVLSASAITSLTQSKSGSAFTIFRSQLLYAGIGTVGLLIASRIAVPLWKKLALPILGGARPAVARGLHRHHRHGNRNWLRFGPVSIQPSELVKFGLVLFGALALTAKRDKLGQIGHVVVPYLVPGPPSRWPWCSSAATWAPASSSLPSSRPPSGPPGSPLRWFLASALVFGVIASAFVISSPNRLGRFDVWLGRDTDMFGAARQPMQGRFALADGGWFGLGLGASREKWQWLSEPHNDFIFAIIGEELGLPGTLLILLLFGLLAYACYRLVLRSKDMFVRLATAGAMAWIVAQAMVNIGAVIGLLPVIGVPLPLVSRAVPP